MTYVYTFGFKGLAFDVKAESREEAVQMAREAFCEGGFSVISPRSNLQDIYITLDTSEITADKITDVWDPWVRQYVTEEPT